MSIRLKVKVEGLKEALAELGPAKGRSAAKKALNDVTKAFRTAAGREIRAKFAIKAADLNKKLKAIGVTSRDDLTAEVVGKSAPMSLMYFKAREVRDTKGGGVIIQDRKGGRRAKRSSLGRGVTVEITKGKKTRLPNAFIAAVKAGKSGGYSLGVFERMGKKRLPIEKKATITLASMLAQKQVLAAGEKAVRAQWSKRFRYHLQRARSRGK